MLLSHAISSVLQVEGCFVLRNSRIYFWFLASQNSSVMLQNFRIYFWFLASQKSSVMLQNFRICLRVFRLKSCFCCQIYSCSSELFQKCNTYLVAVGGIFSLDFVEGLEMFGGLGGTLFGVFVKNLSILRYEYCECARDWGFGLWG